MPIDDQAPVLATVSLEEPAKHPIGFGQMVSLRCLNMQTAEGHVLKSCPPAGFFVNQILNAV
jgi:hypothetical protein